MTVSRLRRAARIAVCGALLAVPAHRAGAAVFTVVNNDGAGEGLNDTTARSPVGGNEGPTLGAQRRIAIARAAGVWGAALASAVPIRLAVTFDALYCDGNAATLGSAGPTTVLRDFPGAPRRNTWYPQALANALAGSDQLTDYDDIEMQFSSTIDSGCLPGLQWYYGLDGQAGDDEIDFTTTVLHEIAHGLGFLTFVDPDTGDRLGNVDDVFMDFPFDATTGQRWPALTDAQRAASSVADGALLWSGDDVVAASGFLGTGRTTGGLVEMYAPMPVESGSSVSHFNTTLQPDELIEPYITAHPTMDLTLLALADIGWPLASTTVVTPTPVCAGDCDDDGSVTVDELVRAVSIALGTSPLSACSSIDSDGDGVVSIAELLAAVDRSTDGCAR
jgi:hypothetical protein